MCPQSEVSFSLVGNTLVIRGALTPDDEPPLVQALRELIDTDSPAVVIDMSQVHRMSSACVRHIILAMLWMMQRNRGATVRARPQVFGLLRRAGGEALGTLEQVGD